MIDGGSADDWRETTIGLLPRGDRLWTRDPDSNINKIATVLADERKAVNDRALQFLNVESFPTSAIELMAEWEQAAGLPDPCRPLPGTLADRWAALADVFFSEHDPTPENMEAWAASAGWNIDIREQRHFVPGVSMAGDVVGESDFVWIVSVLDQVIAFARAGLCSGGDALWTFPDLKTLECILRRAAPGHTQVYFIVP